MKKLTGLQKQVLGLYRGFLRAARSKGPEERKKIEAIVSQDFHRNAMEVARKNFVYIEYLLRRGFKQLDQLKSPATVAMFTHPVRRPPPPSEKPNPNSFRDSISIRSRVDQNSVAE